MKINHFGIGRRGDAGINWDGTKEEIDYFQKWVEKYVPSKYFFWYERVGKPGEEFHDTHLSGNFDVVAWTFLCYHWTTTHAPAINQKWKEKKNPYYPGQYPFEGESSLEEYDAALLCLARADLQKHARNKQTPELKEVIDFMHKKWQQIRKRIDSKKKI